MNLWYLPLALVLLLANGFFVWAEFALIAARRTKIEELAAQGSTRAKTALKSLKELSLMLAGAQLGITMASLGLGIVAEPAVARLIEAGLLSVVELPSALLHSISFVTALTIIVYFHMVIGEMAPKNIAIAVPEKSALWLAVPFRLYVNLFRPFIHLLNALSNGGIRLLRVEPVDELQTVHTAEEIGSMVAESAREGMLGGFKHRLLSGAIGFSDKDAVSVMVPRTEMVAVPDTVSVAEVERIVFETGHSRLPVYGRDIDDVLGFVHVKDLLEIEPKGRNLQLPLSMIRRMLLVPESRKLHPLLRDMRREATHFALVIDEHSGTAGIVTLEDLVEELVGEIRDEYDQGEVGIERLGEERYLVPGTLQVHEACDLGLELPPGEYETVTGFLMDRLGRIPRRNDSVHHARWCFRVQAMHRHRVVQVVVERGPTGPSTRNQGASDKSQTALAGSTETG